MSTQITLKRGREEKSQEGKMLQESEQEVDYSGLGYQERPHRRNKSQSEGWLGFRVVK